MNQFPHTRLRRLRASANLRSLVQETELSVSHLIYPLFVVEGVHVRQEIESMPGCLRFSLDELPSEIGRLSALGIKAVLIFGVPESKDEFGSGAYASGGIVQEAIRVIKGTIPEMLAITDVCLCEYTSHGHCGVVHDGLIDNDATLPLLARTAVSQARAGADMVAPSAMMDGQVVAIRRALDEAGFVDLPIMSYSAKYRSAFYGPFREAAASSPQFGDRSTYQMNPLNLHEAMREIAQDIAEGADIVMVKPALAYLDVIRVARERFDHPLAAYNVSGEYAMIKAASKRGWIDERQAVIETVSAMRRAGADIIISYYAPQLAQWLGHDAA